MIASTLISTLVGITTLFSPDLIKMPNMRSVFATALLAPAALAASEGVLTHSARYDYIIVGGGTSGLVVANRLSEDYNVSVAVIEAGDIELYNPNVTSTAAYTKAFGTAIDWQYESAPQIYAGNASQVLRAAKALGGTSDINGTFKKEIEP